MLCKINEYDVNKILTLIFFCASIFNTYYFLTHILIGKKVTCKKEERRELLIDLKKADEKFSLIMQSKIINMQEAYIALSNKKIMKKELEQLDLLNNWNYPAA